MKGMDGDREGFSGGPLLSFLYSMLDTRMLSGFYVWCDKKRKEKRFVWPGVS